MRTLIEEWPDAMASPTTAVIDSQSVETTEAGGPRGYDAGKKALGGKRQAMVDTSVRAADETAL